MMKIKNRVLPALATLAVCVMFACQAWCEDGGSPAADADVLEVHNLGEGAVQVVTGAGYNDGALPGARLEIVDHSGGVLGWVLVSATEAGRSSGLFEPSCEKCAPSKGDEVFILSSGLELPPGIADPAGLDTGAAGENLTEKDYEVLQGAFKAFMDGGPLPESGALVAAGAAEAPAETDGCPEMSPQWTQKLAGDPDPDADVETDIFMAAGDFLLISGMRDEPFCAVVGEDGYVRARGLEGVKAAEKTIADFENRVKLKHIELVGAFDATLMPAQYMTTRITVHIIGEAASPGPYMFDRPVTAKEAIKKAGAIPSYDGRLVLVRRKPDGGAKVEKTKVSPPGYDLPDAPADETILGNNDILFLVRTDKHEKEFLVEVLPFLVAQTSE